ncbi:MAG TPA: RsmG family class I SAM-dependent methyltransferase [Acidimicrobiales bacterium]
MIPSPALQEALERSRRLGALGPGPIRTHVDHAAAFLEALAAVPAGSTVVDLGSGGGVPGLVVLEARPDLSLVLLDAMEKRTALLVEAVAAMGAGDRCRVVTGRAEDMGRSDELRGAAVAVLARSFGPPAVTAECGSPFLALGGRLVVSEPPQVSNRWPVAGLAQLGLEIAPDSVPGAQVLVQRAPCPARFPRRNGIPAKRPLF